MSFTDDWNLENGEQHPNFSNPFKIYELHLYKLHLLLHEAQWSTNYSLNSPKNLKLIFSGNIKTFFY